MVMDATTLMETIREAAQEVYNELGAGYIESIYEEAMAVELRKRNIKYEIERTTEVFYKNEKVGEHKLDFVVDDQVVVELKAGASLSKSHKAQLLSYMKTCKIGHGLLINFPYPEDESGPDIQELP